MLERTADTDANHNRRAGVRSGQLRRLDDEVDHPFASVGGREHFEAAHVLATAALGEQLQPQLVTGEQIQVNNRCYGMWTPVGQDG